MNCRLCMMEAKLIKAHVIPEALLSLPTDDVGAAKMLSNTPGMHPKKTRTGIYDINILCEKCDGELGKLDQHVVEHLLRFKNTQNMYHGTRLISRAYTSADPETVRKFVISVVWRASITKHSFFRRVDLGVYEEKIRQHLIGATDDCDGVSALLGEFDKADASILDPHFTRFEGVRFWLIYANRFIFYLKTDRREMPTSMMPGLIKQDSIVSSIVRNFAGSKERGIMRNIAQVNPGAFPRHR